MTEYALWAVLLVWGAALLVPMARKVWAKYVCWYLKNFRGE